MVSQGDAAPTATPAGSARTRFLPTTRASAGVLTRSAKGPARQRGLASSSPSAPSPTGGNRAGRGSCLVRAVLCAGGRRLGVALSVARDRSRRYGVAGREAL